MRRYALLLALAALAATACLAATEGHSATGMVLKVDATRRSLVVSCEPIPGYMGAMTMPFTVHDPAELKGLKPGMTARFTIVEHAGLLYAENIQVGSVANFEPDPFEAGGLKALHSALNPSAAVKIVAIGQRVPDFVLTDQAEKQIRLAQFQGKVVALTFGYSRCPYPNYCFSLSNNLALLARDFHSRAGRDLVLLTIAIDPEHDKGAALAAYANVWKADPAVWHFLTGPLPQVKQVAGMFGMDFWREEGLLTHSLHTVIIDRDGRLAANIEGNQFDEKQLAALVQTVMDRPH